MTESCVPCRHRTFTHDVPDEERRALFLEWLQTCVVGKHIVWKEQGGPNLGQYWHCHPGRLDRIEPDEPMMPIGAGEEHKAPTLQLVGVAGRVWASGMQAYDGDQLYSFAEVEPGYVDSNGSFEWQHFGDWLQDEKGIYWHPSQLAKLH